MDQERNQEFEAELERRLASRPLDKEDMRDLIRANGVEIFQPESEPQDWLAGKWARYKHDDTVEITFTPLNTVLDVQFQSSGDLADWTFQRTAVLNEGMLIFDYPVFEYCSGVYDQIYGISNTPEVCLVSQYTVRQYWASYLGFYDRGLLTGTPETLSEYFGRRGMTKVASSDTTV